MSTEQIEANAIIGKFDGWYQKNLPKNGDIDWFHEKYTPVILGNTRFPSKPENFKYHTSWDWLMPILKKFNHLLKSKQIEHDMESSAIHDCLEHSILDVDINSAHKLISQLIQWYNKTNQS